MNTHLPTARRLIQERVPELMDLKPGCVIETERGHTGYIFYECKDPYQVFLRVGDMTRQVAKKYIKNNLGSPIHLEHVLLAIQKPVKMYTKTPTIHIDVARILALYDLSLPFDQQSEAFYEGVVKVLGDKE